MPKVPKHWTLRVTRADFDGIANTFGIQTQQDWYSISVKQVNNSFRERGKRLKIKSMYHALQTVYPEYEWTPHLFSQVPHHYWKEKSSQRKLMDWISEQLGIVKQDDWFSITVDNVRKLGGMSVLNPYYNGSLYLTLKSVYPEFDWNPLLFSGVPHSHAQQHKHQKFREYFDRIGESLNVQKQEDWYQCKLRGVRSMVPSIIDEYNGSLFTALCNIYPEYEWNPMNFKFPPRNYVEKIDFRSIRESLDECTDEIAAPQWNHLVSSRLFARISNKFGGALNTLKKFYPEVDWSLYFGSMGEGALEDVLKAVGTVEREKNIRGYSVDFYLPQYRMAFEFQGGQHYKQIHTGSFTMQWNRDIRKKDYLNAIGITLVEVPYWWNGQYSTLYATLKRQLSSSQLSLFPSVWNPS